MKAMTNREAASWCKEAGPKPKTKLVLSYGRRKEWQFFVRTPEEHRGILALAHEIVLFRGAVGFDYSGGLLWLRRWDLGSPQLVRVGWRIIEGVRHARGESRPIETAPAQFFRNDELVEMHACLVQVMCFGWVGDYVPGSGDFFLRFKDNFQVRFVAKSAETYKELRMAFAKWGPNKVDPIAAKIINKH